MDEATSSVIEGSLGSKQYRKVSLKAAGRRTQLKRLGQSSIEMTEDISIERFKRQADKFHHNPCPCVAESSKGWHFDWDENVFVGNLLSLVLFFKRTILPHTTWLGLQKLSKHPLAATMFK